MESKDIIQAYKELPRMKVMSESADPRLISEIKNAGIDIYGVKKPPGSVLAGISVIKGFNILITEKSLNIIKEIKNYTWKFDEKTFKTRGLDIDQTVAAIKATMKMLNLIETGNIPTINYMELP